MNKKKQIVNRKHRKTKSRLKKLKDISLKSRKKKTPIIQKEVPEEKNIWLSLITISDEVKKSVALAYSESAVFLDQIIFPVFESILSKSADEVLANK